MQLQKVNSGPHSYAGMSPQDALFSIEIQFSYRYSSESLPRKHQVTMEAQEKPVSLFTVLRRCTIIRLLDCGLHDRPCSSHMYCSNSVTYLWCSLKWPPLTCPSALFDVLTSPFSRFQATPACFKGGRFYADNDGGSVKFGKCLQLLVIIVKEACISEYEFPSPSSR